MAHKVRTRTTPAERQAQAQALHDSITEQVAALRGSEQWEKFLTFARSFHSYSLSNVLLILAQRPTATAVAGFKQWQAKGRQVRKGEKALKIFGYATKKITEEEDPATGEELERTITYYPVLSVFDIAQTDPIDGAEDHPALVHHLSGDDPAGIYDAVTDHLSAQGWTVVREPITGANGYTTTDGTRRVVIDTSLSPAHAAKTALHEAAHVLLHTAEDLGEYVTHRGIKETEAESVAYIVAGLLGLDTGAYSIGYVAGWADGDTDTIRATAARVLTAAHTLTDAITSAPVRDSH